MKVRVYKGHDRFPDQVFRAGRPQHFDTGSIGVYDNAGLMHHNGIWRQIDQPAITLFALFQFHLRLPALGDVAGHADETGQDPLVVPHGFDRGLDPQRRTVSAVLLDLDQRGRAVALFDFWEETAILGQDRIERRRSHDLVQPLLHRLLGGHAAQLRGGGTDVGEVQLGIQGKDHVVAVLGEQSILGLAPA